MDDDASMEVSQSQPSGGPFAGNWTPRRWTLLWTVAWIGFAICLFLPGCEQQANAWGPRKDIQVLGMLMGGVLLFWMFPMMWSTIAFLLSPLHIIPLSKRSRIERFVLGVLRWGLLAIWFDPLQVTSPPLIGREAQLRYGFYCLALVYTFAFGLLTLRLRQAQNAEGQDVNLSTSDAGP